MHIPYKTIKLLYEITKQDTKQISCTKREGDHRKLLRNFFPEINEFKMMRNFG